jgi:Cdc6-like AAA superfamily ATPase
MGAKWIQHKGKDILYSDFSNMRHPEDLIVMLDEIDKLFPQKGPMVRHLMNMDNAATSPDFMEKSKAMGKKFVNLVYKDAYCGISPLKSVMLKGFLLVTGGANKAKVFNTVEEAKDWLAEG